MGRGAGFWDGGLEHQQGRRPWPKEQTKASKGNRLGCPRVHNPKAHLERVRGGAGKPKHERYRDRHRERGLAAVAVADRPPEGPADDHARKHDGGDAADLGCGQAPLALHRGAKEGQEHDLAVKGWGGGCVGVGVRVCVRVRVHTCLWLGEEGPGRTRACRSCHYAAATAGAAATSCPLVAPAAWASDRTAGAHDGPQ